MDIAEHALQLLGGFASGLSLGPEAGSNDLEHVAQSFGGDPQVVLGPCRLGVERSRTEGAQLLEPCAHDPRSVGTQRLRRIEALYLTRLHAFAALASLRRRRRSFFKRLGLTQAARPSLASLCSLRRRSRTASTAGRSDPGAPSTKSSKNSIATSRSRRSPSASARVFTRFSALRWRLAGKHGSKTSSAARRRRVATRISCTGSMSSTSSTPLECSKTSATRTSITLAATRANCSSQSNPGTTRARATHSA